ncbi:zinc-ribbon domain-containing protein [Oleiharenicola sp. Vm1]|uniref:zinc-ribbon domain-containing protein n=1 Tax=Oleiharenicola sp. Vm1 TaxID=3398393 RepID=UPI0039F57FAE
MSARVRPPENCPVCGATVPRGARACPECGADERSGWNEDDTRYDGLDLPDEAFRDGDGRGPKPAARRHASRVWSIVASLLVLALILAFVFRR